MRPPVAALLFAASSLTPLASAIEPSVPLRQLVVDAWQASDGLPQNSATAIIQTGDGYVWLATEEGLARFDGVRFEVFDADRVPALGTKTVNVLCRVRDGSLWLGTTEGLVRMAPDGRFTPYGHAEGLPRGSVWALAEDRAGVLWVGTDGGGLASLRGDRVVPFAPPRGGAPASVRALLASRDGSLWVGSRDGLLRVGPEAGSEPRRFGVEDGLPHPFVASLWEARNGDLWAGTNGGGLARWDGQRFRAYGEREGLPVGTVLSVLEDRDGSVWAATNGGGVCRLSGDRFECLSTRDGLPGDLVVALAEDREGGLWIGTSGGGIGRIRVGRFLSYGRKEGLSGDVVLAVLEDRDGAVWAGTAGSGLNRLDPDGRRVTTFGVRDGLPHAVVLSLAADPSGGLWIGTAGGGLTRFDGRRFVTLTRHDGLASDLVQTILVARDGAVWVGTNGAGLSILRGGKVVPPTERLALASDNVIALLEGSDGTVWAGTTAGLSRIVAGRATTVEVPGLTGREVLALHESADGALWVGTQGGGLFRVEGGRVGRIRKKDGLLDDLVGAILEDAAGRLWMTCNKGVFRASRSELEAFVEGRIASVRCVRYGTRDGMRTAECNGGFTPSGWRARDGKLWFPTGKGLVVTDPALVPASRQAPPVRVEAVVVDGVPAGSSDPVRLRAGARNLELRFTALAFEAPQRIRFRYRLEGFDDTWVEAGSRRAAYYTRVPAGSYRFLVQAYDPGGSWIGEAPPVSLSMAARFRETPAFYLLCLAAAGAAVLAGHRLRIRSMRRRVEQHERARALLEKLVDERTAQLRSANEALESFSYSVSHDLRAPLRALDGFSVILLQEHGEKLGPDGRHLLDRVRGAALRMGHLVDALLRLSRVDRQPLERTTVDMTALARSAWDELVASDAGGPVELRLDLLPAASGDAALLRQVWLNLLSNALKFSSRRAARVVTVRGRRDEGHAVYEVEDNGVGFDQARATRLFGVFERLHTADEFEGTGVGLSLVRRIVTRHGGGVSARGDEGVGATLSFTLPDAAG